MNKIEISFVVQPFSINNLLIYNVKSYDENATIMTKN
jgi:hypothetical protein